MATQWMDDFTSYGTGSSSTTYMLNGLYAECDFTCATDPDPHGSGQSVLRCQVSSFYDGNKLRKVLSASQTTVGVACRQWLASLPSGTSQWPKMAEFRSQENTGHLYISVDPSGYLYASRMDSAGDTTIATSTSPVVTANAWFHYEVKVVLDATNGSVEVRQEGVTKLLVTGVRTTNNKGSTPSCANVVIANSGSSGFGPMMYIKDFIVWDGTGSTNNDFFGSCQVYKIIPDGDVSLGWTPSTGTTGYNLINEAPPDDDTTYIAAATSGLTSTFTLSDTPVDTTSVRSVMSVHRSRKLDGGDGNIKLSLVNGGTENGTDRPITTAYTYWYDVFDVAPDGGSWTKAKADALQLTLNRTV